MNVTEPMHNIRYFQSTIENQILWQLLRLMHVILHALKCPYKYTHTAAAIAI